MCSSVVVLMFIPPVQANYLPTIAAVHFAYIRSYLLLRYTILPTRLLRYTLYYLLMAASGQLGVVKILRQAYLGWHAEMQLSHFDNICQTGRAM